MSRGHDARLAALGIVLPPVFPPAGNYLGCKRVGDILYVGGHGPVGSDGIKRGKVGRDLDLAEAQQAAHATALSMLATVRQELGTLDRVRQVVKVFGMVNCAPGFNRTPAVMDGPPTCWWRCSGTPDGTRARPWAWRSCPSTSRSRSR